MKDLKKALYCVPMSALLVLTGCGSSAAGGASSRESAAAEQGSVSEVSSESVPEAADDGAYKDFVREIIDRELFDLKNLTVENTDSAFSKYTYYSAAAERESRVNVLLPPGYSEDKQYPVLYILHGFYGNEDSMKSGTRIPEMLAELYKKGEAEEMIVVLPYIFVSKELPYCTDMDLENCLAYDNFIYDLTESLMPFIESKFSVKKGRENTAITGFSMGGRESLFIGVKRPDIFGYVGACCPAPGLVPIEGSPMHPGQLQESELTFRDGTAPRVLFISAGGNDNVVGDSPRDYHKIFDRNGDENFYQLMDGKAHDNSSVIPHLYKYFGMVFK